MKIKYLKIGKMIKEARDAMGLRQGDVSAVFGISQATVSLWERGYRHPSNERLFELADLLESDAIRDYARRDQKWELKCQCCSDKPAFIECTIFSPSVMLCFECFYQYLYIEKNGIPHRDSAPTGYISNGMAKGNHNTPKWLWDKAVGELTSFHLFGRIYLRIDDFLKFRKNSVLSKVR